MLVHVVSFSVADVSRLPRSAVANLAHGLRSAGATAEVLVPSVHHTDRRAAIDAYAAELAARWEREQPDLVHTIGVVATAAALTAGRGVIPVVATFDQSPADAVLEADLAAAVAGVLPLSSTERERWWAARVPTVRSGALALPVPVPDPDAGPAAEGGHVLTLAQGRALDLVVASMPHWRSTRLVVLGGRREGPPPRTRRLARSLGVLDRIEWHPGARGPARRDLWAGAAVVVAAADGARHGGHVLEATVHGVPAVALADGAHLDLVVAGTTGLLVDPADGPTGLGRAVARLLADPLRVRGYGAAALVRAQAVHDPLTAGERLLGHYELFLGRDTDPPTSKPRPSATGTGPARMCPDRARLAVEYLPMARRLARRYAGRGQALEELEQVASLGLVKAAGGFDETAGTDFPGYAVPTILGELRRHFRDHAWTVRVPRALQEATLQVQQASDRLRQSLGQEGSAAHVAQELGLSEDEVLLARRTRGEAMTAHSLDLPVGDDDSAPLRDRIGGDDPDLARVEDLAAVGAALRRLPPREREIIALRFYGDRTQQEIAEQLGMSQVHVSRLLSRTLTVLRDHVLEGAPLPASWGAVAA